VVGTLPAARDFSDVRDVVHGYYLAAKEASRDAFLSFADMHICVATNPESYRSVDVPVVYGNAEKLHRLTG
jgi:hypothetical protein